MDPDAPGPVPDRSPAVLAAPRFRGAEPADAAGLPALKKRLDRAADVPENLGQHGVLAGRVTFLLDPTGIVREARAVDDVVARLRKVLDAAKRLQPGAV